ncbi:hypothetical protein CapIbe_001106 [Capra ibex]
MHVMVVKPPGNLRDTQFKASVSQLVVCGSPAAESPGIFLASLQWESRTSRQEKALESVHDWEVSLWRPYCLLGVTLCS